jgi:hypothetical protein
MSSSLFDVVSRLAFHPLPLRVLLLRVALRKLGWFSYSTRLALDAVVRPSYGFCLHSAAALAKALNHPKISAVEFGVAGGNGLVNIEAHALEIQRELKVEFDVFGFDTAIGLPAPHDYRDMPYMWAEGFYKMDRALLERRLKFAKLVIGNVAETCAEFFDTYSPAPIGCVLFDLDYYSSTANAFKIFARGSERYLPRVYCYFDDIASGGLRANNSYLGVLRAIEEFNETNPRKKIAKISGLSTSRRIPSSWNEHIYVLHDFDHPQYSRFIGNAHQDLPLTA